MNKLKSVPAFKTEAEERKFWETHDSTDYIDWSKAERVRFPNLKPPMTAISIRLPLGLLEQIKIAANKRDVPYQSLIKMWLAEKVGYGLALFGCHGPIVLECVRSWMCDVTY